MKSELRNRLINQILWDYDIAVEDAEAVLRGEEKLAGHYNTEMIFLKIIESYSWFTILQLFTPEEVKYLLTNQIIKKLRTPSLRQKYEFVQKRLQQLIPAAG